MAAFRKGHIKAVKWMVDHVTQFPSDQEMTRYVTTINDKELLDKCQQCTKIIRAAKETQAAKANQNATILLEELDMEKVREEAKKAAAARRRDRKKKKKLEKKVEKRKLHEENKKNENSCEAAESEDKKLEDAEDRVDRNDDSDREIVENVERADSASSSVNRSPGDDADKEEGDSGIDANSQGSCSSNDVKAREKKKDKKKKKLNVEKDASPHRSPKTIGNASTTNAHPLAERTPTKSQSSTSTASAPASEKYAERLFYCEKFSCPRNVMNCLILYFFRRSGKDTSSNNTASSNNRVSGSSGNSNKIEPKIKGQLVFESTRHPAEREDFEATGNENYTPGKGKKSSYNQYDGDSLNGAVKGTSAISPKQAGKREEGWKEVVRKYGYLMLFFIIDLKNCFFYVLFV